MLTTAESDVLVWIQGSRLARGEGTSVLLLHPHLSPPPPASSCALFICSWLLSSSQGVPNPSLTCASLPVLAAVSEHASVRRAQEISAVARHSQHQSDRRAPPPAHGRQRPQRPLRQIPDGAPEVQEQGSPASGGACGCTLTRLLNDFPSSLCSDNRQDPKPSVEGAVRLPPV